MQITLTLPEMLTGTNLGTIRQYASDKRGSKYSEGFTEEKMTALASHIEGALGEVCVAKALGLYFEPTVNTYGKADIGEDIGVRTTNKNGHGLLIRERDNPDHFYYLVIGSAPHYRVCGWVRGGDAKVDEYLAPHIEGKRRVWRIPEEKLNSIDTHPIRGQK